MTNYLDTACNAALQAGKFILEQSTCLETVKNQKNRRAILSLMSIFMPKKLSSIALKINILTIPFLLKKLTPIGNTYKMTMFG